SARASAEGAWRPNQRRTGSGFDGNVPVRKSGGVWRGVYALRRSRQNRHFATSGLQPDSWRGEGRAAEEERVATTRCALGTRRPERSEGSQARHSFCVGAVEILRASSSDALRMTAACKSHSLPAEDVARAVDQTQRKAGDDDFPDCANREGTKTLFAHFLKIRAKTNAREGQQKSPTRQIGQRADLIFREEFVRREHGDQQEAQNELRKFLPEKRGLVPYRLRFSFARPINGVGENHETDHGIARGLNQHGELAGGVGVKRAGGGGFGSVVHPESGPEAVGFVAEMQEVADHGEREEGKGTERENCGNGKRRILVISFDGAFRGDDGAYAANGRADSEQRSQLGFQLESAA